MTKHSSEAGFTIIELMIATLIFSSIMLVMTFSILQFSRSYYRGITASSTQTAARSVIEDIAQAIQFSGDTVTQVGNTICVGNQQYDFIPYHQLTTADGDHALYSSVRNGGCATVSFDSNKSRELLSSGMRVAKLSVTPKADNVYLVSVKIVYGDNDLLCNASDSTDCQTNVTGTGHNNLLQSPDIKCRPITGSQFCSVAELTVSVQKRIH